MKIAIFDLDGCVSDDRRRKSLLPANGRCDKDYAAYHLDCGNDPIINKELVESHIKQGHHIVFITARPAAYISATANWLERHFPMDVNFTLLMRPNGDITPCPVLKPRLFEQSEFDLKWEQVVAAYDDRQDILDAYAAAGVTNCVKVDYPVPTTGNILRAMAHTFEERNKVYGSNYQMVGPIMRILFPNGVPPELLGTDQFHLFELKIVKLSRFAISGLTHTDSIHDDGVYSAMIETVLLNKELHDA